MSQSSRIVYYLSETMPTLNWIGKEAVVGVATLCGE